MLSQMWRFFYTFRKPLRRKDFLTPQLWTNLWTMLITHVYKPFTPTCPQIYVNFSAFSLETSVFLTAYRMFLTGGFPPVEGVPVEKLGKLCITPIGNRVYAQGNRPFPVNNSVNTVEKPCGEEENTSAHPAEIPGVWGKSPETLEFPRISGGFPQPPRETNGCRSIPRSVTTAVENACRFPRV